MAKNFQKKKEDFVCDNCGQGVVGDGYTDHCPHCLWGKHVDINPGDRAAKCGGAMKPIGVEEKGGNYRIGYSCEKCDHRFIVKMAKDDDMDQVIKISFRI